MRRGIAPVGIVSLREEITMSVFDSLKEEAKKRKQENQDSADFIDRERERIRLKREEAREKRNIIRKKIKFVDDIASKSEAKKDADELARIEEEQSEKIKRARAERRNRAIYRNKGKLAVSGVVCLAIIFGGWFTADKVQEHNTLENYNAAVDYILNENYSKAESTIDDIKMDDAEEIEEIEDASALKQYAEAQLSLEDCEGQPSAFVNNLKEVGDIENEEVNLQYENAVEQAESAVDIQREIIKIDIEEISLKSKESLEEISKDVTQLEDRYVSLIDDSKLVDAQTAVTRMEKGDDVGKVMIEISEIGAVSLDSKPKLESIRKSYEELPGLEKDDVLNYKALTDAESKLTALQREKEEKERKEAEEKARKEAEEKAKKEAEEKAKQDAEEEQNRSMTESSSDYTVYWVPNGEVYHSTRSCSALSKSRTIYEGPLSKCPKSRACTKCY